MVARGRLDQSGLPPSDCLGSIYFLEGSFDIRDLGAVLEHEEPLPHPARDQAQ
jgi:hypothetical protein